MGSSCRRSQYVPSYSIYRTILGTVTYSTILESYTLEEILELNDLTPEDCLEYLVEENYLKLPSIKPLDFNE